MSSLPPPPTRQVADIVEWMHSTCRIGDVVLTGGRDTVSRLIQSLTQSDYSHVAVVTCDGTVTEAYDYQLTLSEGDEGSYATSFETFVSRSPKLSRVSIYRPPPELIDEVALRGKALELHEDPAPYPTLGGVVLLLSLATGRAATRMRRRIGPSTDLVEVQSSFWGDGTDTMHCGELATRLLEAGGVDLHFRQPLLQPYVDAAHQRCSEPEPADKELAEVIRIVAIAEPSARAARSARASAGRVGWFRALVEDLRRRAHSDTAADTADFVLPGDLTRADPLTPLATMTIDKDGATGIEHWRVEG